VSADFGCRLLRNAQSFLLVAGVFTTIFELAGLVLLHRFGLKSVLIVDTSFDPIFTICLSYIPAGPFGLSFAILYQQ
jgi:hypothetical protein